MKRLKSTHIISCISLTGLLLLSSCNEMLEIAPPSSITPESYLTEESQLTAYAISRYEKLPNADGGIVLDNNTDNEAGMGYSSLYTTGDYKVGENGGDWEFGEIYQVNYFLDEVMPKYRSGAILGDKSLIDHAIGEMYFFRALQYYNKLRAFGDYPIVKHTQKDNLEELTARSIRSPRSEVARFIISDLDSAFIMMKAESPDGAKNRLYKPIAQLLKARVALYEGTWLKYFKGTAFVPNGEGWPGATRNYNKGYQYPAGSIDGEIKWLLGQAMEASDYVASRFNLTPNSGVLMQSAEDKNPYMQMFSEMNLKEYEEILLWRDFDYGLGVVHNRPVNAGTSNQGVGLTRGFVQSYLMTDGLPYYASSLYKGDNHNSKIVENRDDRIRLFMKQAEQKNIWLNVGLGTHGVPIEPTLPDITSGSPQFRHNTGYTSRKYWHWDHKACNNGQGETGVPIFRAAEAYLIYMEASYELLGTIDAKADGYWRALRRRARISENYQETIQSTDMQKEAVLDWAAYSAGAVLSDATLFNIRRERRNELLSEGFRLSDLNRWRSMDQLVTTKYHIEGFKLWNSDYTSAYQEAKVNFIYDGGAKANVSSPQASEYLRPYEIFTNNSAYEGYGWHMAHYLTPIAMQHFNVTSSDENFADSPIYQNPYWDVKANTTALK